MIPIKDKYKNSTEFYIEGILTIFTTENHMCKYLP